MLDDRLSKIASLVKKDAILLDIGCDHGFLTISLLNNNLINKAYAADVNEGPLKNVKNNVKKYQLESKIDCILSDGLEKFTKVKFDCVVIAGMGGSLIADILSKQINLIRDKQLILQPNINSEGLRKFLLDNNIFINQEYLIKDNDIFYYIIECSSGTNLEYSDFELKYGKNIEENEMFYEYLNDELKKYKKYLKKIPKDNYKHQEFLKKIEIIEVRLNEKRKTN